MILDQVRLQFDGGECPRLMHQSRRSDQNSSLPKPANSKASSTPKQSNPAAPSNPRANLKPDLFPDPSRSLRLLEAACSVSDGGSCSPPWRSARNWPRNL